MALQLPSPRRASTASPVGELLGVGPGAGAGSSGMEGEDGEMGLPDLETMFRAAIDRCAQFDVEPTEIEKLELYGLLQQAYVGDALLADKPPSSSLNFAAKAKFQAHYANRGKLPDVAMTEYILMVERLARHCEDIFAKDHVAAMVYDEEHPKIVRSIGLLASSAADHSKSLRLRAAHLPSPDTQGSLASNRSSQPHRASQLKPSPLSDPLIHISS